MFLVVYVFIYLLFVCRERLKLDQGKEIGKSILFFGCRHENGDFLFK